MNPACISFFELESINVDSKLLLHTIHPDDQSYVLSRLKACIEGQNVSNVECRVKIRDNEHWLSISTYLSNENRKNLLIGKAGDITVHKTNMEVLNNHNNKKNSILNILAHDLAGPIGTIGNLSVMLARETADLKQPLVDRYISMINRISKSSTQLIHDFLNQEFLESAGVKLLKKRVELVQKIKLTTEEFLSMQQQLNIQFSCDANKDSIYVEIDEDKFMQVINNLISNALKFTPEGGSIHVKVKDKKKEVLLSVADTGIGIPKKFHATLFDKFGDARRSGLKGEHSTGLGMSIIKTIVEWHSGKIWFETEEGKGTTFYIQLPK